MVISRGEISDAVVQVLGDAIKAPRTMRLGNPITKNVHIPISEFGLPGLVWVHGISVDVESEEDDKLFSIPAVLKPNKIPQGLQIYGTPVLVFEREGGWQVEDLSLSAVEYLYGVRDRDQRTVDLSRLDLLAIRPTNPSSMSIEVSGGVIVFKGRAYFVTPIKSDLSSYAPFYQNNAVSVLVEIDPLTNSLNLTPSNEFADKDSHLEVFPNYKKDISPTAILIGWVKLKNPMTGIEIPDILHAQEIINKPPTITDVLICFGDSVSANGEIVTG